MQVVPHQVMGYDRAITVFSPDGRLLQVEYAKKAVSQGTTALGIVCKEGVVLMADRARTDKLIVSSSVKKVFEIDDHIITTASGIMADARVLVKKARVTAQQHKLTYGESIDTESLVISIADLEQAYTQYGGIRPFGISLLIAGVNKGDSGLYLAEPTGTYFRYNAKAIGMSSTDANKFLEKNYKSGMSIEQGVRLAKETFKRILGKEFNLTRLETVRVTADGIDNIRVS